LILKSKVYQPVIFNSILDGDFEEIKEATVSVIKMKETEPDQSANKSQITFDPIGKLHFYFADFTGVY